MMNLFVFDMMINTKPKFLLAPSLTLSIFKLNFFKVLIMCLLHSIIKIGLVVHF